MAKYNKNEIPLRKISSLSDEIPWDDYEHKGKFHYVCTAIPDGESEKLRMTQSRDEDVNRSCVYVMVIDGRIFKIGSALRGVKKRIGSYNSGRGRYRNRGTNSGANYWVLQSMINFDREILFYAYYPPVRKCTVFGETLDEPFPSAKTVEGVILRQFQERYGKKPIGCTQG